MFDATEEAFDKVATTIRLGLESARIASIGARRDHGLGTRSFDLLDERVAVVALVSDDGLRREIGNQFRGAVDVGDLAGAQYDPQRIAPRVDRDMQFRAQSSPRPPKCLRSRFFWAPAECWCARTMVESMSSPVLVIRNTRAPTTATPSKSPGIGGAPFSCFKFRTMRSGADQQQADIESLNEASGPLFKIRRDPRQTRVGRVLRRSVR